MKKYIKFKGKYIVSDQGEVWKITTKGLKIGSFHKDRDGYLITCINNKRAKVHRVVMEAFKGKCELTVDHLNRNKNDNRLCNLEYVTVAENNKRGHNKKVEWNGSVYKSATELSNLLGYKDKTVSQSIYQKRKIITQRNKVRSY